MNNDFLGSETPCIFFQSINQYSFIEAWQNAGKQREGDKLIWKGSAVESEPIN